MSPDTFKKLRLGEFDTRDLHHVSSYWNKNMKLPKNFQKFPVEMNRPVLIGFVDTAHDNNLENVAQQQGMYSHTWEAQLYTDQLYKQ